MLASGEINALTDRLYALLGDGEERNEHELLKACETEPIFSHLVDAHKNSQLALFQHHFILKHALYTLRRSLLDAECACLEISLTRIQMHPWRHVGDQFLITHVQEDDELEHYYLNLDNLRSETEASVEAMLDGFWQRYTQHYAEHEVLNQENKQRALSYFELTWPCELNELKRKYRSRAQALHPDRGGDHHAFHELRRHYETLHRYFRSARD